MTWDVSKMWVSKSFPQKMRKKNMLQSICFFDFRSNWQFLSCFNVSIDPFQQIFPWSSWVLQKQGNIFEFMFSSFILFHVNDLVSLLHDDGDLKELDHSSQSPLSFSRSSQSQFFNWIFNFPKSQTIWTQSLFPLFMSSNCSEFWSLLSLNWLLDSSFCHDHVHFGHNFKWNHNWFTFSFENKTGCLSCNLRSHEECSPQFWKWIFFIIK